MKFGLLIVRELVTDLDPEYTETARHADVKVVFEDQQAVALAGPALEVVASAGCFGDYPVKIRQDEIVIVDLVLDQRRSVEGYGEWVLRL